jgi:hypothetical protein
MMAIYRIDFVDDGGSPCTTHELDCADDKTAIEEARTLNLRFLGMGFDLWDSERLVHKERR